MNLQGNGNNHNHGPKAEDENDSFISFRQSADYERITGQKPVTTGEDGSADFGDEERSQKLREAIESENSSAYEDLDDFVYRQNKRRKRSNGRRHHHSHRSPSSLSPGRVMKKATGVSKHKHKHHFHRHHHRRRKLRKWQKAAIGVIAVLLALIVISVGTLAFLVFRGRSALLDKGNLNINVPDKAVSIENGQFIEYNGVKYRYNDNITSILCMGIDKDTFSNDKQHTLEGQNASGGDADSIFLVTMDLSTGDTKLVNISRDTMTDIKITSQSGRFIKTEQAQLSLAYAYGDGGDVSCQNALTAVRNLFYGTPINSYLALDMQGIGYINDAIGGVTVVSPETIDSFVEGKTYNLQGTMAQAFVRSRSHATVEGNSLRMQRQKVYLESFAQKLLAQTRSNLSTPVDLFNSAKPYIVSNINTDKIAYLAVNAVRGGYSGFEIKNVPGEVKAGKKYAEFYVNEDEFFEMFLDIFYIPTDVQ